MRLGFLGSATATSVVVLGTALSLAPAQVADRVPEGAEDLRLKFDHAAHAALESPVAIETCKACHGDDGAGVLAKPGEHGHQPCLSAGCHAEDFLSVGARTRKESPERYRKAAAFCQGCHKSRAGQAPSPFAKAKADNLYAARSGSTQEPGHYVEMDHQAHVRRTQCSSCHVVDAQSFALAGGPTHKECASCHEDHETVPMPKCTRCHNEGAPKDYFKSRTLVSDVRSCGSARYAELSRKRKRRALPCFKHEREGHRIRKDGEAVQCNDCHFMFQSTQYAGHKYQSLHDVKQAPLMDNHRDRAHQKCGASGCHRRAVDDAAGTGRCSLCHSSKAIVGNLLEETADE